MKIKSKEIFLDTIQGERAWRKQELTNLKYLIHQSKDTNNSVLLRSGVLLLYAHWEGYIKKVCESFFCYINFKAYKYSELNSNFTALGMAEIFNGNFSINKYKSYSKLVVFALKESKTEKFKIDIASRIDTKSNLNTEVLVELLCMLGLDSEYFENNRHHIDNRLLKLRNAIAHGERTDNNPDFFIGREDFDDLYQRINALTDYFEAIVINHLELESYKIL